MITRKIQLSHSLLNCDNYVNLFVKGQDERGEASPLTNKLTPLRSPIRANGSICVDLTQLSNQNEMRFETFGFKITSNDQFINQMRG